MKTRAKIITFVLITFMLFTSACGNGSAVGQEGTQSAAGSAIVKDREGNPITLPETIDKVISMGPSNTEVLVALGCGDRIIAIDTDSEFVSGIEPGLPMLSIRYPDGEQIVSMQPDVIFITGMSKAGGGDPFKAVEDAGVCIVYIPSSTSIDGIKDDIRFIAEVMGEGAKGDEIVAEMENELEGIKQIGEAITDKKTVYFEISPAPEMYSFGKGVFLNEMIELVGARNILGEMDSWLAISAEAILAANPDVILTSVNYIDNSVGEIKSRPGWGEVAAVKNDSVYYIDADACSRPNQNIIKALKEMAKAIYPDKY